MKRSFFMSVMFFLIVFYSKQMTCLSSAFHLITVLYNETNKERMQEYMTCLEKNLAHPAIATVHVLYDTSKDTQSCDLLHFIKQKAVKITYVNDRPTFGFCFDLSNKEYPDCRVILSNADIYFNQTLHELETYNLYNKFVALTRWNVTASGDIAIFKQFDKEGNFNATASHLSQDVWIFKTPLKKFVNPEFRLGTWACDGYIAYQAYISGLQVINPCLTVQCCHLHLTQLRHWLPQSIPGAKALIVPWQEL